MSTYDKDQDEENGRRRRDGKRAGIQQKDSNKGSEP